MPRRGGWGRIAGPLVSRSRCRLANAAGPLERSFDGLLGFVETLSSGRTIFLADGSKQFLSGLELAFFSSQEFDPSLFQGFLVRRCFERADGVGSQFIELLRS